jgi:hypothetical protein
MKHLFLLLSFVSVNLIKAQAPNYDDLLILFADENYEKLIRASEKYTNGSKTKNDALPYLFFCKGLYKISFVPDRNEKYKNALKESVNYMGTFLKKDLKTKEFQNDVDIKKFINEYKSYFVELILNDITSGDYKKAASWLPKYYKLVPKFAAVKLLEGLCKIKNGDKSTGSGLITEGDKMLVTITEFNALDEADKLLLMNALMSVAQNFVDSKQPEKGKAMMAKGAVWFEGNDDWKVKYDEIVN